MSAWRSAPESDDDLEVKTSIPSSLLGSSDIWLGSSYFGLTEIATFLTCERHHGVDMRLVCVQNEGI